MSKSTIQHEMMHALGHVWYFKYKTTRLWLYSDDFIQHQKGFMHEQTRPDRDDYIDVLFDNW